MRQLWEKAEAMAGSVTGMLSVAGSKPKAILRGAESLDSFV